MRLLRSVPEISDRRPVVEVLESVVLPVVAVQLESVMSGLVVSKPVVDGLTVVEIVVSHVEFWFVG